MRIAVAVASAGRAQALTQLLPWIRRQTKAPSQVILVVTAAGDLPDPKVLRGCPGVQVAFASRGSSAQRNRALDLLDPDCDAVFFIDDDYLPCRTALAGIEQAFDRFPDAAGLTGRLLADGVGSGGLTMAEAGVMILAHEANMPEAPVRALRRGLVGLYGCNMAIRTSAIGAARFDERLPLYGWQEDVDFAAQLTGDRIRTDAFVGVHCGLRAGRDTNGRLLGYSQVANAMYLWRKGTLPAGFSLKLVLRNLAANHARQIRPEPWIDRRGRARGNRLALRDLLTGRMAPERILDLAREAG